MSSKPKLTLVPRGRPATHAEIAQIEFRAVKFFRGMSQTERTTKIHAVVDRLRPLAVIASEMVAMTKPELIERVSENYDTLGPLLMQLADLRDEIKALSDTTAAAEVGLACALANVEDDPEAQS
jgi:hypothetical protein